MLSKLAPITISLNGTDVTNCYAPKAGAIQITDSLNQPVACALALSSLKLPFPLVGGELLTIQDDRRIYYDGVVPVEGGLGTEFLYLDTDLKPEAYRKYVKVTATDYQSVLDFQNIPDRTFYYQSCGDIVKTLIGLSLLNTKVDVTEVSDGYVIPQYVAAGRKFSNVVKELGQMNGFYFSLYTTAIDAEGNRQFKAEFRSLSDRPAPITIDRDALKYELRSLKFDPRDNPLVNKVTVVGGMEPSSDVQIDEFVVGTDDGKFALSKVPYYLKTSELFTSDFSKEIALDVNPDAVVSGTAFQSGQEHDNELDIIGSGTLCFVPPFQSREQRYTTFEEILLDLGASITCGLMKSATPSGMQSVAIGVRFNADSTISYVLDGIEYAAAGDPTWRPRTNSGEDNIYSLRIKETQQGTMCELQGGNLSPVRHWMPIGPTGKCASGFFTFRKVPKAGDTFDMTIGQIKIPQYTVTLADEADATLHTLQQSVCDWLNGNSAYSAMFIADLTTADVFGFEGSTDIVIRTTAKTYGVKYNEQAAGSWILQIQSTTMEIAWNGLTGGTDVGAILLGQLPDSYFAGIISENGASGPNVKARIHRVISRDPVGVEVQLVRSPDNVAKIAQLDPARAAALAAAQRTVVLTVGSGDELAEQYSAQILLEGNTAVLSFFDDVDSLPQDGDLLRVSYRYGNPIKVTVQDYISTEMVRKRSNIAGDTGIREAVDIDMKDKIFSSDSAAWYATNYLHARSGLSVQGSVLTNSMLTDGIVPLSGQTLSFQLAAEDMKRSEVVSQVTATHRGTLNMFDYTVAFGKVPDEFLLPPEGPVLRAGPDAFTYNVQSVNERLRLADDEIKFTVL
jgi:hypothetical protein